MEENKNEDLQQKSAKELLAEEQEKAKVTFISLVFYFFVVMTIIAFLFRVIGLDWFASTVEIQEPSRGIQIATKAVLKAFEAVFSYLILTKKKWYVCLPIAIIQTACVGFIPTGIFQTIADGALLLIIPLLLRKDKLNALIDFIVFYAIMTLYGLFVTFAKFGTAGNDAVFSFYYNIAATIDYKLFIVTLFLFIKHTGGIRLWKEKRAIFS